jgi:two-component system response regulator RegX3
VRRPGRLDGLSASGDGRGGDAAPAVPASHRSVASPPLASAGMPSRVLLVEDETSISEPLASHLAREGYDAEVAGTLAEARAALARDEPDVILLDVMLPDGDGRDLCREVRTRSDVPIVMLTARGEEVDRIVGLELGADDYVVKPFSAGELVARIRAIQRRGRSPGAQRAPITVGQITLDPASRTVTKDGAPIELAAKEFDLLRFLMSRAGEVVGREEIMDEVWDPHWFGPTKTLDVHVSWLRKKIENEPSTPRYITTVRGVGFRFASPDDAA